jgi:type I restriction enzyme M protein
MNMLLHGAGDAADIKLGDTLATPAFVEGENLRTFDIVVANPPFSSKNWGHERFKAGGDPFGRIKHLPPKSHGEIAGRARVSNRRRVRVWARSPSAESR